MGTKRISSEKCGGFSLVELTVVIIIAGLMIAPVYTSFYEIFSKAGPKEERIDRIRTGLAEHLRIHGVLPCPAPLGATPGDANYYTADCGAALSVAGGTVLIGAVPVNDLNVAMHCWDPVDMPASIAALPGFVQDVMRKSMNQVNTIMAGGGGGMNNKNMDTSKCVTEEHIVDEYNNKIIYAVTTAATNIATFPNPLDPNVGRIIMLDENGNAMHRPATNNGLLFVLISHGPDGKGAISGEGITRAPACGPDTAERDNENCDDDEVFRNMPLRQAAGNNHFDDFVEFSLAGALMENNYWNWSMNRDVSFVPDSGTMNRILLGVDTDDPNTAAPDPANPDERLVVDGNVLVGGTVNVQNPALAPGAAGNMTAGRDITGPNIQGDNSIIGKRFCYKPALTPCCQNSPPACCLTFPPSC